jgi:4'-phosphopantetheinyl transferase
MTNIDILKKTTQFVVHSLPDEKIIDPTKIHIWFYDLDDKQSESTSRIMLSSNELARVERLRLPEQSRLAARFVFVRKILGNIVNVEPRSLKFHGGLNGKPRLDYPIGKNGKDLNFNVSHSENILALIVSFGCEVGIDIEVVKPDIDFFSIAKMNFDQKSFELLCAVSHTQVAHLFYHLWTRKEALTKMYGVGITDKMSYNLLSQSQSLYSFVFSHGKKEIIGSFASKKFTQV